VPIFPAFGGNRTRILNMIAALKTENADVHFVMLPSRQMGIFDVAAHQRHFGRNHVHVLKRNRTYDSLYFSQRTFFALGRTFKKLSRQKTTRLSHVDETFYADFGRQLAQLHERLRFDAVVVQYVTFSRALYAFDRSVLRVIDTHDMFAGELPSAEEAKGLARADIVLAIQPEEARYFRDLLGNNGDVRTVSHIIGTRDKVCPQTCSGATFLGSNFAANRQSLAWFINAVLPLVVREIPGFKLRVAGSVCESVPDRPDLMKVGITDTVTAAFAGAPILVNPIVAGTGIKIKLLEAMGAGVPAVTTEHGAAGIDGPYRRGMLVVPDGDAEAFASSVVRLCTDHVLRQDLSEVAFQAASRWNAVQLDALAAVFEPA
jgi:glycosyltransferase involved in cell wall biosynthesis